MSDLLIDAGLLYLQQAAVVWSSAVWLLPWWLREDASR